jgi:hypothetical protein
MTTIPVKGHTRRKPERKPDPLIPDIQARKAVLFGRYKPIPRPEQSKLRRTLFWLGRIWSA